MRADALEAALAGLDRPALVVAQAGQRQHRRRSTRCRRSSRRSAPTAAGSTSTAPSGCGPAPIPSRRHLVEGIGDADSWTTDAHKWLNVPYDSGLSLVRRRGRAPRGDDARGRVLRRDRRARSATRTTGSRSPRAGRAGSPSGRRCARWAGRASRSSSPAPRTTPGGSRRGSTAAHGVRVLNDVVLNQVLVRFEDPSGDPERGDARTDDGRRGGPGGRRRSGWAARPGTARGRCGSRSRAGRRPTRRRGPLDRGHPARRPRPIPPPEPARSAAPARCGLISPFTDGDRARRTDSGRPTRARKEDHGHQHRARHDERRDRRALPGPHRVLVVRPGCRSTRSRSTTPRASTCTRPRASRSSTSTAS